MAATIISGVEKKWYLSKEQVPIKVKSSNFISVPGKRWKVVIQFDTMPSTTDTLTLGGSVWGGIFGADEVFTFKATPTLSNDIELKGTDSVRQWLDSKVIPSLSANQKFSSFYTARRDDDKLVLEASEIGTGWDIDVTVDGFDATITNTAGVDMSINSDFKIRMRVWCTSLWNSGQYRVSPWAFFDPKAVEGDVAYEGIVYEDLSEMINGMIVADDNARPSDYVDTKTFDARKVFIEIAEHEITNEFPFESDSIRTPVCYFLKGARRQVDQDVAYHDDYVTGELYALSHIPTRQVVGAGHFGLVHFHRRALMSIKVKTYDWDSTGANSEISHDIDDANFIGDLQVVDVTEFLNGDYRRVDVYANIDGDRFALRTYEILHPTHRGCTVAFKNSFGVMDTIWCDQAKVLTLQSQKQALSTDRRIGDPVSLLRNQSFGRKVKPTMSVITMAMNGVQWFGSADIVLSKVHWISRKADDGTIEWLPCSIEADSFENASINGQGEWYEGIKMKLALNEEVGWSNKAQGGL